MTTKPIIIITGSVKSIFFEVFFKSLKMKYQSPLILICNKKNLIQQMKKFRFKKKIELLDLKNLRNSDLKKNSINLINIDLKKSINKKKNIRFENEYIKQSFDVAFKLIKKGIAYKLMNGPINKKTFLNKKFLGITEYISNSFKQKKTGMLIYNKKLSVCPLTTHLPIKLVAKKITKKFVREKIEIINEFFKKNFKLKPKIAVTGLNPHCESILNFNEDERIISSVIKSSIQKKINIKGPFPADTIFLKANRKKFDVILGMYHDQVLTPLKTLYEYDAINITMGLPFLRVSPDHGPNQKMIGKNISDPLSIIKALKFLDKR